MKCLNCGSQDTIKMGERYTHVKYSCKSCGSNFKIKKEVKKTKKEEIKSLVFNSDEKYLWLIFAFFSILYFFTYINANNVLIVDAGHDDALYFWLGQNISMGNWLGKYMQLTLAKMPSYAMFIAFSMKTGIPYLWLFSICNIIAVTFLLVKSKYLFSKAKWILIILGILLLFNPILAQQLRIYRFQLPAICFLVFIATIISTFNPESKKQTWVIKFIDALIISIAWGMLWFSREEYIFYVVCILIALVFFFIVRKSFPKPLKNLIPIAIGILGVFIFWFYISSMNYSNYDRFITCEKTSSPYTDLIKTFNSISDPDFPENISGSAPSREKIIRIGQAVPMFRPMAKNLIEQAIAYRGQYFDNENLVFINEPENVMTISHFEWAWIAAAANTGYYKDATTLANYYRSLNTELKKAITEGRLSVSKDDLFTIGPYTLSNKDMMAIIGMIPKNYTRLFPEPSKIYTNYKNILARNSNITNEKLAKRWSDNLKINYLTKVDDQSYNESINSFSNKIWNIISSIFAYSAMPLIHLSLLLAFIALIVSIIRKQWINSALISIISSTYVIHYLMLTIVGVIASFDAAHVAYYLPSYAIMLFGSFLAISIIFNLQKKVSNVKTQ